VERGDAIVINRKTHYQRLLLGFGVAALLGVSSVAGSLAQTVDPALAEAYNSGLEAATMGDYEQARTKFEAALAIDPKYTDAHYNLGLVYQNLGQFGKAAEEFGKTLELDPGNKNVLRLRAEALLRGSQPQKAVAAYEKAIAADSTNVDLYFAAADAASKAYPDPADLPKVIQAFGRAMDKAPKDSRSYSAAVSLGTMCSRAEDYTGAIAAYKKAAALNSKADTPHYNMAVVYQKMSKFQDAVTSLDQALAIDPKNGKAHYMMAGIYYNQLKNDQKALEHYEAAAADGTFQNRKKAKTNATTIREYLQKKKEQQEKNDAGQ
jgi:tetratricopeptide (TPR) repeat protein